MEVIPYIAEQEATGIINLEALFIELNYDQDDPTAQAGINQWELGVGDKRRRGDAATLANKHIDGGLTNGVGIGEGLPFKILIKHSGQSYTVFDGYFDLTKCVRKCDQIDTPAIETESLEAVRSQLDGVSFESLFLVDKTITDADMIPVPYIISTIPDYQNTVIAMLGVFVLTNELKNQLQALKEMLPDAGNPFTATVIIKIILRVAYLTLLVIAIVKFIKDIFNLIIQPVKYHYGMHFLTTAQKAAEKLGYQFKSSILESFPFNKMAYIPQKDNQKVNSDMNGVLGFLKPTPNEQVGYFKGTAFQFFEDLKSIFKAKIIVRDGVIRLEREDYRINKSVWQMPPVEILENTFNFDQLKSNYMIRFATDDNDKNTRQVYPGTLIQVQTLPIAVTDKKKVLLTNFEQVFIPYARAIRKTELTYPERIFDSFFKGFSEVLGALVDVVNSLIDVVNHIIKLINKVIKALETIGIDVGFEVKPIRPLSVTNLANLIENRIGMMLLENDFLTVPKILLVEKNSNAKNNKALSINEATINAEYLYDNFHFVQSFVPSQSKPNANQYLYYEVLGIPFKCEDYLKLRAEEGGFLDPDGRPAETRTFKWYPHLEKADIGYKVNVLYTKNLKEQKILSNGK